MTFAVYKGGGVDGKFTKGKTYIVSHADSDSDSVNTEDISIRDEDGNLVKQNTKSDHHFEFCEMVYGVVLFPILGQVAGDIVNVRDISKDETMFMVDAAGGSRMIKRALIELVDHHLLSPGIDLYKHGIWSRVEMVDESMWVQTEGSTGMAPLIDYRFSVSDGEIDTIRTATCIDDRGAIELNVGEVYRVREENERDNVVVIDRGNSSGTYDRSRFDFN